MTKICFIYTETTGLHNTNEFVSKKNLYNFARMVTINYNIGIFDNNEYNEEINIRKIIKPRCLIIPESTVKFHNITQEIAEKEGQDIENVLYQFKNDIKDVEVIVSHNIDFHLKTIQAELVRYNIAIDFNKYTIIDTISYNHSYQYPKLKELCEFFKIKKTYKPNIELIINIFFKLLKNKK